MNNLNLELKKIGKEKAEQSMVTVSDWLSIACNGEMTDDEKVWVNSVSLYMKHIKRSCTHNTIIWMSVSVHMDSENMKMKMPAYF